MHPRRDAKLGSAAARGLSVLLLPSNLGLLCAKACSTGVQEQSITPAVAETSQAPGAGNEAAEGELRSEHRGGSISLQGGGDGDGEEEASRARLEREEAAAMAADDDRSVARAPLMCM